MRTNIQQDARQVLAAALATIAQCPRCGQSRMIRATAWRGHGNGQPGAADFTPLAYEPANPRTHCICVGGPVWIQLEASDFGRELRLSQAVHVWAGLTPEHRDGAVVYWDEEAWHEMPLESWRLLLLERWEEIRAYRMETPV